MLRVEPIKLDIQVIRVNSFLRRQLQSIGEGIVPILHELLEFLSHSQLRALLCPPISQKGGKPIFEMVAEAAQSVFIGGRLEPPNTGVFVLLLNQSEAQRPGQGIKQDHSDVDPLIADQIRRVPQNMVDKVAVVERRNEISHRSHPVGKRVPGCIFRRHQQLRHHGSPPVKLLA